jgi:hypothetical protein
LVLASTCFLGAQDFAQLEREEPATRLPAVPSHPGAQDFAQPEREEPATRLPAVPSHLGAQGFAQRLSAAPGRTLWRVSLLSLSAANAFDMHSSWGKHELNPMLGGPTGKFGTQGALMKLGLQGGLMGVEYLLTRGHPSRKMYRVLSVVNFGASAGIGAVAARNYGIR